MKYTIMGLIFLNVPYPHVGQKDAFTGQRVRCSFSETSIVVRGKNFLVTWAWGRDVLRHYRYFHQSCSLRADKPFARSVKKKNFHVKHMPPFIFFVTQELPVPSPVLA